MKTEVTALDSLDSLCFPPGAGEVRKALNYGEDGRWEVLLVSANGYYARVITGADKLTATRAAAVLFYRWADE